jgi:hypothetical protein
MLFKRMKPAFNLLPLAMIMLAGAVQASDHINSPSAVNDPIADISDFYAFMNPPCTPSGGVGCTAEPEELILVMTVNPGATRATQFSENVDYHFYFENDVGVSRQIDCSFTVDQLVTCAGLNGLSAQAPVGEIGVNGDLRVFAGLRDDPFFADLEALENFKSVGILALSEPGVDSLAGTNVLAIVLGIKNNAFPAGSGAKDTNGDAINVQKVWVASERTDGDGINGAITGSWYNPDQTGQGWVIEVAETPAGGEQFLVYFYGYDNNGEQLWLISGGAAIEGATATADVYRTSGTGFGGDFNPGSFDLGEAVGSMAFEFDSCDSGMVSFASADTASLADFTTDIERITNIHSLDCSLLSAGQIDRKGRPSITTLIPEEQRDAYSTASDPGAWPALFTDEIEASMAALDLADGVQGNGFISPAVFAEIAADDRLQVDLEWSACAGYFTIETSDLVPQPHTNDCGGRKLSENVIDDMLSMQVSSWDPSISDFVDANDVPFLTGFPFLAAPH